MWSPWYIAKAEAGKLAITTSVAMRVRANVSMVVTKHFFIEIVLIFFSPLH
jgi:hypothetical protein